MSRVFFNFRAPLGACWTACSEPTELPSAAAVLERDMLVAAVRLRMGKAIPIYEIHEEVAA
jgi:hypothetical protein